MSNPREGLARSVQVRLARHAREIGVDPNLVLTRYAVERFLYRLSRSAHAERFVLKGALLMLVWLGERLRPTSDADLLGFGELTEETLGQTLKEVVAEPVEPDAVEFDADSVRVEPIRAEDDYVFRVSLNGTASRPELRETSAVATPTGGSVRWRRSPRWKPASERSAARPGAASTPRRRSASCSMA
jgi:hypothetical protein